MTQQLRESLSAIMDGEGNELELRRVLKGLDESPEQAEAWRRYHVIGSAMRRERYIAPQMDISSRVMSAIALEQQEQDAQVPAHASRRFTGVSFMGGAAVAAAVSLMVVTGVQVFRGNGTPGGMQPDIAALNTDRSALDMAAQQLAANGPAANEAFDHKAMADSYADFSRSDARSSSLMPVSWQLPVANANTSDDTRARGFATHYPSDMQAGVQNDSARFQFGQHTFKH